MSAEIVAGQLRGFGELAFFEKLFEVTLGGFAPVQVPAESDQR